MQVGKESDHAVASATIHALVVLLQVLPQRFQALIGTIFLGKLGEHRANRHHHGEVAHHVRTQTRGLNVLVQVERFHHDARYAELLAQALDHRGLIDALALATDKVAIEVDVGVVHGLTARQRYVCVDIIHVERVCRHRQIGLAQYIGAIAQAVHKQVLIGTEMPDLVPRENLFARQGKLVANSGMRALVNLLVHVVRDKQVDALVALLKATQNRQHGRERRTVEPVVRVNDLVIGALCLAQAREDGDTVAAILLVHRADDSGITGLPLVGLGGCLVLRAVVHHDNLDIGGVIAPLQDGGDAMVHILGGVI